ncbi:MAG TPA: flagellar basal body rod protein FlgB [Micropepsaceae bacterium]|nr:flagellar basal body rod protein FlgB [Micropepsaceae bacterium]
MDLTNTPVLQMLRTRMDWLTARQAVLAENIANANTPGFRARDLSEPDFAALLRGETASGAAGKVEMVATADGHFGLPPAAAAAEQRGFAPVDRPDSESSPNGNSVVLEEQMMRLSETQMDYSIVTGLYKKTLNLFRLALGRT